VLAPLISLTRAQLSLLPSGQEGSVGVEIAAHRMWWLGCRGADGCRGPAAAVDPAARDGRTAAPRRELQRPPPQGHHPRLSKQGPPPQATTRLSKQARPPPQGHHPDTEQAGTTTPGPPAKTEACLLAQV